MLYSASLLKGAPRVRRVTILQARRPASMLRLSLSPQRSRFCLWIALIMALSGSAIASRQLPPVVNMKTIVGGWEAISDSDHRVFKMEVMDERQGFLAMTVWGGFTVLYKQKSIRKADDGLIIVSSCPDFSVRTSLSGHADSEGGELRGTLDILDPKDDINKPTMSWNVRFVKARGGYINSLHSLIQKADTAIREARSRVHPPTRRPVTANAD